MEGGTIIGEDGVEMIIAHNLVGGTICKRKCWS